MQPIPEEYEPLDFVGFTDRGIWSSTETYIENDIVHKDNTVWLCLKDNTTGIMPAEGENWTVFMDGSGAFYGAYDTFPIPGDPGRFYIDDTVDPRLMYTWDTETQKYILTGGAGGADGGSVDIPITLTSSGWTGTTAPYSQTITVPQMREGMTPLYFLASDGDDAQYAFGLIIGHQTGYAEIIFYVADKPAVDLDLILKGIPAQELEYVDNTVVFLVEPSAFTLNDTTKRYEATIPVEGMTEGTGGVWDIVRSGPDLSEAESLIALHITDVDRMDGAVKITCLEPPTQRYMMSIAGAYPDADPGTVILANMHEWFDRVEALEDYENKNKKIYTHIFTSEELLDYGESLGSNPVIYRSGNTVTLKLESALTKSEYENRWNGFLKIPTGFRAVHPVLGVGYGVYGNLTTSLLINHSNVMFVKNSMNTSSGALTICFSATWITNDNFPE